MTRGLLALLLALCLLPLGAQAEAAYPALASGAADADLTGLHEIPDRDAEAFAAYLQSYPALRAVDLDGVKLSVQTMQTLTDACPGLVFHWQVPIGRAGSADSQTTLLDLDQFAEKTSLEKLRAALKLFPRLERVTMYNYRFSVKEMEGLMADFPQVKFDWTILLDSYRIRTDTTAFSTLKGRQEPRYTQDDVAALRYCPGLLALDLGHNNVTDLSFLSAWPRLRRLIVIDSRDKLRDLTPLTNLNDLEYVELFMQDITDLTPLANKPRLLDLNLCFNDVTDLTPLYSDTALERLYISNNPHLSQEQLDALQARLPRCEINATVDHSTGATWRVHKRYDIMKQSFLDRTYHPFE